MTALEVLLAQALTVADFCVFGTINALSMNGSMLAGKEYFNASLLALFTNVKQYQTKKGLPPIVGSQSKLRSIFNAMNSQLQYAESNHARNDCRRITSNLAAHINRGRLVLAVDADEPQQLVHASKTLLKFSSFTLQTHEFLIR